LILLRFSLSLVFRFYHIISFSYCATLHNCVYCVCTIYNFLYIRNFCAIKQKLYIKNQTHYPIFFAASSIASIRLSFGIMDVTGMRNIFSTVVLTNWSTNKRSCTIPFCTFIAAIMASSMDVAEYSLIVRAGRPLFNFFW